MQIRPEQSAECAAIHDLTRRAFAPKDFSDKTEQYVIDELRRQRALALSLVAVRDGVIVGHVAFSPMVVASGEKGWFALGPISVEPDLQKKGIGSALIQHGLNELRQRNARGCILLGDINYYGRFGFVNMPEIAPPDLPSAHLHVLAFGDTLPSSRVQFHKAFEISG